MKSKLVIAWRNRVSGETGYVKRVSMANGCFINTYDITEAKKYVTEKAVVSDLKKIGTFADSAYNDYSVHTVNM